VDSVFIGQTGRPLSVKCNALWTKGKTLFHKMTATLAVSSFNGTSRLEDKGYEHIRSSVYQGKISPFC